MNCFGKVMACLFVFNTFKIFTVLSKHGRTVSCSLDRSQMNVGFVRKALKARSFRLSSPHMSPEKCAVYMPDAPKIFHLILAKSFLTLRKWSAYT